MNLTEWSQWLERIRTEYRMAGMACAVTDEKQLLLAEGYGVTSMEKPWDRVGADTLFRFASNTKLTVALSAMILFERGELDLDAPVRKYIPWFSMSDRITMRKMLSHMAGLPAEYTPDGLLDEDRLEETVRSGLEKIELVHDPDSGIFLYSNWGYRLASVAMMHITGKLPGVYIRELVLSPLGMEHSTFDVREAITYSVALPHACGPSLMHYMPLNASRNAAGGLFSTVSDMACLARLILNEGTPLISPHSWQQMVTPYSRNEKDGYAYGLALMLKEFSGVPCIGHTGSNPPYRSCIWTVPSRRTAVIFASNTHDGEILTKKIIPEEFSRMDLT